MNSIVSKLILSCVLGMGLSGCINKVAFGTKDSASSKKLINGGGEEDPTPLPDVDDEDDCVEEAQLQDLQCPAGQVGAITQRRYRYVCPENTLPWTQWRTISNTCRVPVCVTENQQQTISCPNGQVGGISQTRSRQVCDGTPGEWTDWSDTGNTCRMPVCQDEMENQTLDCPGNQVGKIDQTRTRRVCEGIPDAWGDWETKSNTCRDPVCVTESENQMANCPGSQIGSISQTRTRQVCEGIPAAWTDWQVTGNTCRDPVCNSESENQTLACPTGQIGSIQQSRSRRICEGVPEAWSGWTTISNSCHVRVCNTEMESQTLDCAPGKIGQIVQNRSRVVCEDETGDWSMWNTVTNTCRDPICEDQNETRKLTCPAGQVGEIVERRMRRICEGTAGEWGEWEPVSNSCVAVEYTGRETFVQKPTGGKIDILMVVDNSDSMYKDQTRIATKFKTFIENLKDVDYQIGVTTTDVSSKNDPGFSGKLDYFDSSKKILFLSPNTPNKEELFRQTVQRDETLNCRKTGYCGSNTEQPLFATIIAMTRHLKENKGFFRPEADLAVVIISDEDEKSNGGFNATRPQAVIDQAHALWGPNKALRGYAIIVQPGDKKCYDQQRWEGFLGGGAYYGKIIAEFVRVTGGITGSICLPDYSETLKAITKDMRAGLLFKEVELAHTPIAGTLQVTLTPNQNIRYRLEGRKVIFEQAPSEGTAIEITYKYKE